MKIKQFKDLLEEHKKAGVVLGNDFKFIFDEYVSLNDLKELLNKYEYWHKQDILNELEI